MKIICVIPARYASSRFPGKPLADISGHPMIEWVYNRAMAVDHFNEVIVATDDDRIYNCVKQFGGTVTMTPGNLQSGTDRVAFVAQNSNADVILNLQGDEPLIDTKILSDICEVFEDQTINMATPVKKISHTEDFNNKNAVWVVKDKSNNALYFSRAIIPVKHKISDQSQWLNFNSYFKHIGIYAYRKEFLLKLTQLPREGLEKTEDLEQLRVLENGYKIRCVETLYQSVNVDIPEDIERVNQIIKNENIKLKV